MLQNALHILYEIIIDNGKYIQPIKCVTHYSRNFKLKTRKESIQCLVNV